ncbi:disease resistance protein At4g27190-like [Magnolia sinica]|uniref:disease resistance protein At4g27190-like n=1 Tax=Magnolia sinica TaxID=86752 RepID=UPI002657CDEF|nr:disease resistance protein At4g27190-like [Magnolia sinica]
MDYLGPVVQVILFLWAPVSRQIGYLKHLNDNITKLTNETKELKCNRDDIQANVEAATTVGKTRIRQVDNWLLEVSDIETEVDSIRLEFEQMRTCLNGCCTDHLSRYKLGKRVAKMNKDVQNLKGKGGFDRVAVSPLRPKVLEMQTSLPRGQQNTSEKTLEDIWQCLHDEENSMMCVCGMGGIGKTTLMKAVNNRLIGTHEFDVVIWVTVSKDLNLGSIQEKIGNILGMEFRSNEEKRDRLFARLKNVRYLLILDDLWEAFNLDQVGIPKPDKQNRCKVVITTRSIAVCNAMGADMQIKVKTLTREEAWNLFYERCGDVVLSPDIRPVAEKVVEECGGLPLAIKTVGRAMHRKDKKELWENALRALKGSSPEVPGMEREVFLPLKLSYDYLGEDSIKLCFLYCSLFPVNYDIEIDELVTCWVMEEGFIENVNNLEEASNKAHGILERIKDACLLEEGSRGNEYVRMHDLVHDLAVWITSLSSSSSASNSRVLALSAEGLLQPPEEKMWGGFGRISLMHNKIKHLQITPNCPNLISLFLNDNYQLHTIHSSFFELMPKLQILDLSNTCIESLPMSLSLLVNLHALILRYCRDLVEVPPLGQLKELQLLDLSFSGIKKFPQGIASLGKLKRLDLSYFNAFAAVPPNVISRLSNLEDLRMLVLGHMSEAILGEVVSLRRLTSLSISVSGLNGFIAHDMLHWSWSDLRRFKIQVGGNFIFKGCDKQMNICGCDSFPHGIEELIKHAKFLRFEKCKVLTRLSQLVGDSKSLRWLQIKDFNGLKCIIDWREVGDDGLQCLEELDLHTLPKLEKLFDGSVPRPHTSLRQLRKIKVEECPKLRCLFSSNMVEHLNQLEELSVIGCDRMEEIIEGVLPDNALLKLHVLQLRRLPKLSSICSQQPSLASLEKIRINMCPKLKKLPLLWSGIQEIQGKIEGEREWWEGLQWEDDNTKSIYAGIYSERRRPI